VLVFTPPKYQVDKVLMGWYLDQELIIENIGEDPLPLLILLGNITPKGQEGRAPGVADDPEDAI